MKQLTIRGYDDELERRLKEIARAEGISLNQAAVRLLRKGAGLKGAIAGNSIGTALDDLIGTWTKKEADEMLRLSKDFDEIDTKLWK